MGIFAEPHSDLGYLLQSRLVHLDPAVQAIKQALLVLLGWYCSLGSEELVIAFDKSSGSSDEILDSVVYLVVLGPLSEVINKANSVWGLMILKNRVILGHFFFYFRQEDIPLSALLSWNPLIIEVLKHARLCFSALDKCSFDLNAKGVIEHSNGG